MDETISFSVLEIEKTKDKGVIRDAYRRWGTTVGVAKELGISQPTAARKVSKYVHS